MRLPVPMWQKTLSALGFRRVRRPKAHGLRRRSRIESLERRELFTAAPLLATTPVAEQLERGGGVLSVPQLVSGMTTYNGQEGIAITGTDLAHGTLQYSTNSGSTWTNVGTVSDSSALLLGNGSNDELRLESTDAYVGDLDDAITFRAWDQVTGTDGQSGVDTTTNGGTTAFSDTTAQASIDITPLIGSTIDVGSSATSNGNYIPVVTAIDGAGTSVVAWQDSDSDIVAQFYSASGTAIGSSFTVPGSSGATNLTVSANAGGTFAFGWLGTEGFEVKRYQDDDGTISAVDSSPIVIASADVVDGYFASVGITETGGFVAAWSELSEDDSQQFVYAQQFDSSGIATGSQITVTTIDYTSYSLWNAQLSVAPDGSFALAWMYFDWSGDYWAQAAQYTASGTPQEDIPIDVASVSSPDQLTTPTVSVDGVGGFIVSWMDDSDLVAAHYDSSGTLSDSFTIDSDAADWEGNTVFFLGGQSSANSAATWGVIWNSAATGNLMCQLYSEDNEPLSDPFEIAASSVANGPNALAANDQGDLIAAWSKWNWNGGIGNIAEDFYAQQMQLNQPPTASTMPAVTVGEGASSQTINLSSYFSDADIPYGDFLSYSASSTNSGLAGASVSGDLLTLSFSDTTAGAASVTVDATDSTGNTVSTTFAVTVATPAPLLTVTPATEQVERGGGTLSIAQLAAGMTTYNSLEGIAITGTDLAHGTLQYSTNSGTTWTNVGTVSSSNALLLAVNSNTELRLEPTDAYIGDLDDAITFRAWDQATGTDGSYVDTTTNGGDTAFSDTTAQASIEITPMVGSTISVGSETSGDSVKPTVLTAVDGQGTSVVAWQDSSWDIIAQFYNANGTVIGSPLEVPLSDFSGSITVSASTNGTFAFGWFGESGVEVQRYQDVDGSITAIDSSPIVVAGFSGADGNYVGVGVTESGGFDVGWSKQSGGNELLEVQQYNSSGVATDEPITVATTNGVWNAQLSVAPDGSFAISWMYSDEFNNDYLQAIQYNASGVAQEDSPINIASSSSGSQLTVPTISVDGAGGFVVSWMENDGGDDSDLLAAHYNSSGSPVDTFTVDDAANDSAGNIAVYLGAQSSVNAAGNWGVIWTSAVTGNLMGRFYNGEDESLGDAFEIADSSIANGPNDLASNAEGDLVAAWSNTTPIDDYGDFTDDFYAQQLQLNQPPTASTMPAVTVDAGASATTIDLSAYFSDADIPYGDSLSYSASSSNPSEVTTSVSGNDLILSYSPTAAGTATITVHGTDTTGNEVSTTFNVTSVYQPPTVTTIPSVSVEPWTSESTIDLADYFSDVDIPYGDVLHYSASSSNPNLVQTNVSGSQLTLNYSAPSLESTTITVTGTDLGGNSVGTSFLVTPTSTQVLYWDPGHTYATTGGGGGDGTWDNTTDEWYDPNTGTDVAWNTYLYNGPVASIFNNGPVVAVFAGTGGTITITDGDTIPSPAAIDFEADGYTLSPATSSSGYIDLADQPANQDNQEIDGEIYVATGDTATVTAQINNPNSGDVGNDGLAKYGGGTLILGAAQSYPGATKVVEGVLQAGVDDALPYGFGTGTAVTVADGATFDLNGFNQEIGSLSGAVGSSVTLGDATLTTGNDNTNTTFAGVISGSGGVTKIGGGTWTVGAVQTYTGSTTIVGGEALYGVANAFSNSSAVDFNNGNYPGGTVSLNGYSETIDGTNEWTLDDGTIADGTLSIATGSDASFTISSGTLDGVTLDANTDVSGSVTIEDGLTLLDGSTLTVGNSTFLTFSGTQSLSGTGQIALAGSLALGGINNTLAPTLTIGSDIAIDGSGTIYTSGNAGGTLVNQGTITANSTGSLALSAPVINASGGTLATTGSGSMTVSALQSNSGTIQAGSSSTDTGTLYLNDSSGNVNSFGVAWSDSGAISVDGDTLDLGGSFSLSSQATISNTSGKLNLAGALNNTVSPLSLSSSTGVLTLDGGTITGGTVSTGGGSWFAITSGTLDGVTLDGNTNDSGSGGLTIEDGLTLDSSTLTASGTLIFLGTQSLTGTGEIALNGSIDVNGLNNLSEGVLPVPATLTIGSDIAIDFATDVGTISSNTGSSLVNDGTITVDAADALSISVPLTNSGTLSTTGSANLTVSNLQNNSGTIQAGSSSDDSGTTNLDGTWTNTGTISVDGGVLSLGTSGNTWSNAGTISLNAGTLNLGTSGNTWTNSGTIATNGGTLYMAGNFSFSSSPAFNYTAGTVDLTGSLNNTGNTLSLGSNTGEWNLDGGTIVGGTISASGGPWFAISSGTLDGVTLDADTTCTGSVTIDDGLTLGSTLTVSAYGTLTFLGTQSLTGTGEIDLLSWANAYVERTGSNSAATLTVASAITVDGGTIQEWIYDTEDNIVYASDVDTNQTLYWDPNQSNSAGSNDNTGTWNTTADDWYDPSTGTDVAWINNATAVFGGTAGTVTVGTGIHATGVEFNSTGYTLTSTSNSIALGAAGISVDAGDGATIDSQLTGSSGLTVTGSGTLTLGASNNYSGPTNIQSGTLQIASGASPNVLPTDTAVTVSSGATFDLNGVNEQIGSLAGVAESAVTLGSGTLNVGGNNASTTFAGVISGTGEVILSGTGTWTVGTAQTYTGSTAVNDGILQYGVDNALSSAPVTVGSSGTVNLNGHTQAIGGTDAWTLNGGTIAGGTISASSGTDFTITSGTLDAMTLGANSTVSGSTTIDDGLTLDSTMTVVSGYLSGLTFVGTQSLAGTGQIVLNSCAINVQAVNGGGSPATLTVDSGITIQGSGAIQEYGQDDMRDTLVNQGSITAVNGSLYVSLPLINASNGTLDTSGSGSMTLTALQSNSGTIQADGTGTLSLQGTWSDSGAISVDGGTLDLEGLGFLSSQATLGNSSGTVNFQGELDNSGNTLNLGSGTSTWNLEGGTISGGAITADSGALLTIISGTLDGLILEANTTVTGQATIEDGLTLDNTLTVNDYPAKLTFLGTQSLIGTGQVLLAGSDSTATVAGLTSGSPATLTVGSGITIDGFGYINGSSWDNLVNNGTIEANDTNQPNNLDGYLFVPYATLDITVPFTNNGTIGATGSGILGAAGQFLAGNCVNGSGSEYEPGVGLSDTELALSLDAPGTGAGTTYTVEESTDGVNFTAVETLTGPETQFAIENLLPNTAYDVRVVAENGSGIKEFYDGDFVTAENASYTSQSTPDTSSWYQVGAFTETAMSVDGYPVSDPPGYGMPLTPAAAGVNFTQNAAPIFAGSADGAVLQALSGLVSDGSMPQVQGDPSVDLYELTDDEDGTVWSFNEWHPASGPYTIITYTANVGQVPPPAVAPAQSKDPILYSNGAIDYSVTDLQSNGLGGGFSQSRSWSSDSQWSAGQRNGTGMIDDSTPTIQQINNDGNGEIAVIFSATDVETFDLNTTTNQYTPTAYTADTLAYNESADQFVLADSQGNVYTFNDFSSDNETAGTAGEFYSMTDAAGLLTKVTAYETTGSAIGAIAEIQRYDASGTPQESWVYSYLPCTDPNAGLLASVQLLQSDGDGGWNPVQKVVYSYYGASDPNGNLGDLETATVEDADGNSLGTTYYRYYTENSTIGYIGGLEYVFDSESFDQLSAAMTAAGLDPYTASDSEVAPYAQHYFQYDQDRRVTLHAVPGFGGTATGGIGTYTYSYQESDNPDDPNSWQTATTETLPNGAQNIVYCNNLGEAMLNVFVDTDDAGDPSLDGDEQLTYYQYNSAGQLIMQASPAAVTGYFAGYADLVNFGGEEGDGPQFLSADSGQIDVTCYYATTTATATTPGGVAGMVKDDKVEQGTSGTPILLDSATYYQATSGSAINTLVASATQYSTTTATGPTSEGAETINYLYSYFTGTTAVQNQTTTLPSISDETGSDSDTTTVYDQYGNAIWQRDGKGIITYNQYDPLTGALTESITDVDTADTSDFQNLPSGWSTISGAGLNLVTSYQVDALGRTTEETDPDGNVTYTVYDDADDEVRTYAGWNSTTDTPTGPTTVTRYDQNGNYAETLTMSAAPAVNSAGQPNGAEAISDVQSLTRAILNAAGQVVEVDDYFNLTGITYSATSVYLGTKNVNYYATYYSYDSDGNLSQVIDPDGVITQTVYDNLDRPVSTWIGGGASNAPMTELTENVYDDGTLAGDSNLTETITYPGPTAAGGTAAPQVAQYFYDWQDQLVATKQGSAVDSSGNLDPSAEDDGVDRPITYYTYDNLGDVTGVYIYAGDGVTITSTAGVPNPPASNLLTAETAYTYDARGQLDQTNQYNVNPSNGEVGAAETTGYDYDADGNPTATIDPLENVTQYVYDGAGRETEEIDASPGGDAADPTTTYGYDADGNLTSVTDPDGNTTDYVYDALGREIEEIDPDPTTGVTSSSDADCPTTSYAYDVAGNLQSLTDPDGNVTSYSYDLLGRVVSQAVTPSLTGSTPETTTYAYDGDGNVTQETDPDGRVTTYAYNNLGQETQEQWFDSAADQAEGVSTDTLNYTYDNVGDLLTAGDDNSSDTFSYNVLGQQAAVTSTGVLGAPSVTLASGYDANGDRTALDATIGTAADFQNSYTYDAFGDETSVTQQGGSGGDTVAAKNVTFFYDQDGRLSTINRYANTSISNLVATSAYGYDNDGNLTSLTDAQGSTTFAGYTWTYDAGGLVQTFANSQHTDEDLTYSYDHDNELIGATYTSGGATEESYTYDANGNRTSTGGTSTTLGADDEVTAEAGYTYQSDADGNVTEATDTSTGAYTIYTYDNRNRLTSATIYGNGGTTPTETVTYTYDVFNNLIGRSVTQDGTTTNQSFVFDNPAQNGQMVLAFASTGTSPTSAQLTDRFLWGPAVDQLLADETNITSLTSPGTVDWTLGDNENTIRDIAQYNATTDTTTVVDHIDYNAFGQQLGQTNAAAGVIFGYTGKYDDPITGLQWNLGRWYNPQTGIWMSEDPLGFAGGQANLSEYVGNDPTNATDPFGENPEDKYLDSPGAGGGGPWGSQYQVRVPGAILPGGRGGGRPTVPITESPPANAANPRQFTPRGLPPRASTPSRLGTQDGGKSYVNQGNAPTSVPRPRTNKVQPTLGAGPHTGFKRDPQTGKITGYTEFQGNGYPVKRVDITGRPHGGVPTPHTHEYGPPNVNPKTGEVFPPRELRPPRPATPGELPN